MSSKKLHELQALAREAMRPAPGQAVCTICKRTFISGDSPAPPDCPECRRVEDELAERFFSEND